MIEGIKAVAFDLDGTLYFGEKAAEGALDLIDFLKNNEIEVFYFTNNSSKTRLQIFEKLLGLGFDLTLNRVYSSAYATVVYAKDNKLSDVYCIGSSGLVEELKAQNLKVTSNINKAENVIIGLDVNFDFSNTMKFADIPKNCKIVACNRDMTYPVEGGELMPGCGQIVFAIEKACGRKADYEVGKPNTFMVEILAKDWSLKNKDILVVGDTYSNKETDVNDTIIVKELAEIKSLI